MPLESPEDVPDNHLQMHGDCYSSGERAWMEWGQRLRGRFMFPLLRFLTQWHVHPDHLSALSLACGIAFGPLWYWGWKWSGITMLALHVLLDGIDGPLARHQQIESPRGSFTDSFCDQAVVTVVAIALMIATPIDLQVLPGALFIALYIGVLTIAMIRNSLNAPYSWLVRPRFFFFAAIPLHVVQVPYVLVAIVWISNVLLLIKLVSGFFRLKQRLRGPNRLKKQSA